MAAKKNWPSIRNGKPATSTPVKYYPGLGYAPIRKAKKRKKSKNSKLKIA